MSHGTTNINNDYNVKNNTVKKGIVGKRCICVDNCIHGQKLYFQTGGLFGAVVGWLNDNFHDSEQTSD